jgi:hypothetical protein
MKIVHMSAYDTAGGAARAAYRLHRELVRQGLESSMLVCHKQGRDSTVDQFTPLMTIRDRIRRRLRRGAIGRDLSLSAATRPGGYERFSDDRSEHGAAMIRRMPPVDVVHLHWISGFVDYRLLPALAAGGTRSVWTLHDLTAFTGGCHYDLGCQRYNDGCGSCPQLGSRDKNDLSRRVWERKRRLFGTIDPGMVHIVAPSR